MYGYSSLINTLEKSAGAYFIPRWFMIHKMTVYDILLCGHTLNINSKFIENFKTLKIIHTRVTLKTIKYCPKFSLVEGVLS